MKRSLIAPAVLSTGLAACGSDPSAPESCPSDAIYTNAGCLEVPDWPTPSQAPPLGDLSLTGLWALELVSSQVATHPQAEPTTTRIVWKALLRVNQVDLLVPFEAELCALTPEPFANSQFRYPQATLSSFQILGQPARLEAAQVDGDFFAEGALAAGWTPTGAPNETIPSSVNDPRVMDSDGDSLPGVLEEVSGAINGQRQILVYDQVELDGRVASESRLEGSARVTRTQAVLSASDPWLESALTFESTNVPNDHRFTITRLGADATCADVIGL